YSERIRGDRAENLEGAIAAYRAALEVRTRADFPVQWATTQNNLGTALRERIRGDRAENLEGAIAAYRAALEVYTRADFPVDWAMTQNNLGTAYSERIRGDRAENLEGAIAAYRAAIDGAQAMGIREYERRAARNLGGLHYDMGQWSPAYTAFDTAIAALEAMRTQYFSEEAKTRLAEENVPLYARMTDTCLHLGRPQEALERAEAGKSRLFLDQLGYDVFPTPSLPRTQQPLLQREAGLSSELRALENAIRNAPDEARRRDFVAQQGQKRAALDEVWVQLEPHALDYVVLRRGDPVKYNSLQTLVDGFDTATALVEFYTLPDKIIVFTLRSGEKEPVVAQVPMPRDRLWLHVGNYWREVVEFRQRGDIGQRWQELAGPLLADVLPHLQGAELVYLVPHGFLHYLPLHALRVDGGYLIDRFPIVYAPSAAVLARVVQRTAGMERTDNGRGALVLGYTSRERERVVFEGEAVQVAGFFDTRPHLGSEATGALLREKAAEYDTLHLSCHGFFHPTDPLASGLQLADGVLTARDIMGLKLNANLVTLSACQTALSDQQPGDELVGLTRALLYAGASSVLVTLWSVSAVAALELMRDFYRRLRGKDGRKVAAVALREAMLELRKQREHPYYWAPFILVGDWR
ncbi:MAG: CHAT domain-containing protein, partial [Acidobacteria bacterium]|nr:CHAT domain-containing protein [Acidobacteriota bacterium]